MLKGDKVYEWGKLWAGQSVIKGREDVFLECEEDVNKSPLIRRERCRRQTME